MIDWYEGMTEQDFKNAINHAVIDALKNAVNDPVNKDKTRQIYEHYVNAHLKLWAESGIPAPVNEVNSIQSWLMFLASNGKDKTIDTMRQRMNLLLNAAQKVHESGTDKEDEIGIYDNRPDLRGKK